MPADTMGDETTGKTGPVSPELALMLVRTAHRFSTLPSELVADTIAAVVTRHPDDEPRAIEREVRRRLNKASAAQDPEFDWPAADDDPWLASVSAAKRQEEADLTADLTAAAIASPEPLSIEEIDRLLGI